MIPLIRVNDLGVYSLGDVSPKNITGVYLDEQLVPADRMAFVENGIDIFDAEPDSIVAVTLRE